MAKILQEVQAFVDTDENGVPVGNEAGVIVVSYVVGDDGNAALRKEGTINRPIDETKIVHDTGAVGEWWRDTIDAIKGVEGIV